jgi:hypothetical protein
MGRPRPSIGQINRWQRLYAATFGFAVSLVAA